MTLILLAAAWITGTYLADRFDASSPALGLFLLAWLLLIAVLTPLRRFTRPAILVAVILLAKIEGITPPRFMPWVTRHAYHLYTMLYEPGIFGERSRDEFVQALEAEGVPAFQGYKPLSGSQALRDVEAEHPDRIRTTPRPNVEWVSGRSVWLAQDMLMGTWRDTDDIVEAIAKIKRAFTG